MYTVNKIETFRQAHRRGYESSQRHLIFCLLITALLCLTAATNAASTATYYLDANTGNDANPGTSALPWKTIDKAFRTATYGDTVLVRDGNYGDFIYTSHSDFPEYNGSITAPLPEDIEFVTFKVDVGHTPIFTKIAIGYLDDYQYYTPYIFDGIKLEGKVELWHCVGIRFKNMEIVGPGVDGSADYGFRIQRNGQYGRTNNDIIIEDCNIHTWHKAIVPYGNNIIIRNCDIHNIGCDHIHAADVRDILIENNIVRDSNRPFQGEHPDGITFATVTSAIIRNNILYNLGNQGMFLHGGTNWASNLLYENNLIYNTEATEIQFGNADHVTIRHNTIIGDWDHVYNVKLGIWDGCTNVRVYNNLFLTTYNEGPGGVTFDYHDNNIFIKGVATDPGEDEPNSYGYNGRAAAIADMVNLFVDPEQDNFQLKEGSRAIDFGTSTWEVPEIDILGNPRDAQPDAGCYEYGASQSGSPVLDDIGDKFVGENETLTFDVNATDPNGETIIYSIQDKPTTANFIDQTFSWTPTHSEAGEHKVTFIASDGTHEDSETITITVGNAPVLEPIGNHTVEENNLLAFTANATDADGNPLTYSASNRPQGANFDANTGEFDWIPTYQDVRTHSVTFTVTDDVYTDSETISITVDFKDSDSDSLPDSWETLYFGNLLQGPDDDPDNDGLTNLEEYQRGTDPTVFDEVPSDLILHMKFDDDPSDGVLDSSTYGNHGSSSGSSYPTVVSGRIDNAYDFDGVDDYVDLATLDIEGDGLTISIWLKADSFISTSADNRLISKATSINEGDHYWMLSTISSGGVKLRFRLKTNGTTNTLIASSGDINTDEWVHATAAYDGSSMILYKDGAEVGTLPKTGTISINSAVPAWVGQNPGGYAPFDGTIDEVRIYNRALAAGEILGLYNEGTTPDTNAPVLATIGNKSVNENSTLTFDVNAVDPDGDTITYSYLNLPSGATFVGQTFSWTPSYEQAGTYPDVTFIARDIHGAQDSERITITVNNVNRPPNISAIPTSLTKNEGETLTPAEIEFATDPDGETLTYIFSGWLTSLPYLITYNDASGSPYTLHIDVSDGTDTTGKGITITVNNVNRAPDISAMPDTLIKYEGEIITTTEIELAQDPDGDTLTYTYSGWLTSLPYTTTYDDAGTHTLHVDVSDGTDTTGKDIAITVTADTSAPSVINLSPQADSIQAPLNSLITLNVVDAGKGVDANSVTVQVNNNVVYSGNTTSYSSSYGQCHRIGTKADYTFIYQSDQNFEFGRPVSVTVNATDLKSNVMDEYSYSFRAEMRSFGENKRVNLGNLKKGRPVTVRDGSNDIWAAWHAGPIGGSRDIYIDKLAAGADNFGSGVQLTNDTNDQCNPVIAVGSDDTLYVAWQDNKRGNWDIYISTSNDGETWSAERITDSNDNQINPAIVVDSTSPNNAYIVWEDDRHGNKDIYLATSSDGFATKTVSPITSDTSDQIEPAIAADSDNTIYVVWTDTRNSGKKDIYGAASNNGPWTNIPVVAEEDGQSSPAIATEAVGSILHLVWVDDRTTAGDDDIFYAKTTGGLSPLMGSSIIDDDIAADQISPVIITTGTGNDVKAFACWRDERNADADLYLAEISSEGDYGANVLVGDDGTNSDQSEPAIGIDEDGEPFLVWTNERTDIYYAGSTFIDPDALASEDVSTTSEATVGTPLSAIDSVDDASVEVPQGAYLCDVKVTISKIKNPQKLRFDRFTGLYEFGPSGMELTKPVTITIPYEVTGSENVSYKAYWYNPLTNTFSQEGITDVQTIVISSTLHALRFKTTHFSPFFGGGSFFGGGGGGGGGCSMSPNSQASIVELLLPYICLAVAMVILKLRDRRKRKTRNIIKSGC